MSMSLRMSMYMCAHSFAMQKVIVHYKLFAIPDFPENDWYARGYVCIDGQHWIEKATRLEMGTLPAVVLRMEEHVPFLYASYDRYVEYWNGKLRDRTEDAQRWYRSKNN